MNNNRELDEKDNITAGLSESNSDNGNTDDNGYSENGGSQDTAEISQTVSDESTAQSESSGSSAASSQASSNKSEQETASKNDKPKTNKKAKDRKESKSGISYRECRAEFDKIIWPNKKELTKQTFTVIVTSIVFGVLIFVMDAAFNVGYTFLMSLF